MTNPDSSRPAGDSGNKISWRSLRRKLGFLGLLAAVSSAGGCISLAGEVVDQKGRPHTTAKFSIGRPDGLGSFATHPVDKNGRFKFSIFGTDENYVYVFDGAGDAMTTARRVERGQMGTAMRIVLPKTPAALNQDLHIDQQYLDK